MFCQDFGDFGMLKQETIHIKNSILDRAQKPRKKLFGIVDKFIVEVLRAVKGGHRDFLEFEYASTDCWANFEFVDGVGIVLKSEELSELKTVLVKVSYRPSITTVVYLMQTLAFIYELLG